MKTVLQKGRITEIVRKRSIRNRVHGVGADIVPSPAGKSFSTDLFSGERVIHSSILSADPIEELAYYAVHRAANYLAVRDAGRIQILTDIMLPEGFFEEDLRKLTDEIKDVCSLLNLRYLGGNAEVNDAVLRPVICVTGTGLLNKKDCGRVFNPASSYDIVMTKAAALEGTAIISSEKEKELLARFYPDIVNTAKSFKSRISVAAEMKILSEAESVCIIELAQGGVLAGLWELSSIFGMGLDVDMRKIPIAQETVEICEYFSLNPYELLSGGAVLAVCKNGEETVKTLEKSGIKAAVLGALIPGREKILRSGEDAGCLNRPAADAIFWFYRNLG